MVNVMIVEDDEGIQELIRSVVTQHCDTYALFDSAEAASQALDDFQPDLAIIDINLAGTRHGVELAWYLRQNIPDIRIIVMSAFISRWDESDIRDCGVDHILEKPFDLDEFEDLVVSLLKHTVDAS